MIVVCTGAWFLVRTPPPPSEAALPQAVADGGSKVPDPTLPVPGSAPAAAVDSVAAVSVVVHVAGAVVVPGVYELEAGSRVDDAVARAGGPADGADAGRLNLAALVVDGARIYVPTLGEDVPVSVAPVPGQGAGQDAGTAGPPAPVDVNRATNVELETLPGVGPATAAAIVTERERNGPFSSFEDLERVPGIGPAKLAALTGLVTT